MSVIRMEQVSHRYGHGTGATQALRDIHLRIEPREFVALWGPSGSGKTTLCNLAGGIDIPTAGQVWIDGQNVGEMTDNSRSDHRNRSIGFIFQQFNLIPVMSALENVMLPLLLQGRPLRECRARALDLLAELGIAELGGQRPDKLSGGQRQRVAVARALIHAPALVIADEPTANLDSDNAARIVAIMRQLNQSRGATFLFATHDPRLLDRVGRRIELRDGRIVDDTRSPA